MGWFSDRAATFRAAINRPVPKVVLGLYVVISAWDTLVAQFFPPELAEKFPNVYESLKMTSGFLPLLGWALLGMLLVTGISVEYAFRKNKKMLSEEHVLEIVVFEDILTVTVRRLLGFVGLTKYALSFSWSTGGSGVFDMIEGHHVDIYSYDFDGDETPEVIVRYHCGAHTHVMHIYRILKPPLGLKLLPGGEIGSDFPEIKWETRRDDRGVIIYAKNRNWEGSPASDAPIIERYIFENGECVNIPHDRIVEE